MYGTGMNACGQIGHHVGPAKRPLEVLIQPASIPVPLHPEDAVKVPYTTTKSVVLLAPCMGKNIYRYFYTGYSIIKPGNPVRVPLFIMTALQIFLNSFIVIIISQQAYFVKPYRQFLSISRSIWVNLSLLVP